MLYNLCFYFMMFIFFSILCWIIECLYCSILQKRFIHDRGFLIGPYCPIYGYGALYMYIFLNKYSNNIFVLFTMSVVGITIIEYVTSYFMEKMFKARWWDYSSLPFNIEGRVCLKNSLLFGIMGIIFIYLGKPLFTSVVDMIPDNILIISSIVLFILFLIDNILSFLIMSKLKKNLMNIRKDSTSDIDKQVREILSKHTYYISKLFRSFPKVTLKLPKGDNIIISIRKTLDNIDELRKERKSKVKEIRKSVKESKK